ncbi:S1/P1 nuclease [Cochleicola gelatinilyticus]|uniref:S1/P1 Nuclease n=1 Tax=Cochleicola gelatinilyticus TaxID=1763537 RepID=A0A167KA80_9FLAO|nr:S1/P1 nuclease [Cochleicola gelatinilyticus]OAB81554.1 S1/P1 Nuclease [Cochleicola gelatinilyticus]
MKRFPYIFIFLVLASFTLSASEDWGRNGHRATGEIAEKHLTKKAKRAIAELMNGESLALMSTYADEIKSDKAYRAYGPWHYVNFPFGATYEAHDKSDKGDLIQAINTCISVLKDATETKENKVFHLKLLVHFIGDLHQPLHVGMADDKGGNDFQVQWFGEGTNLHSVWDTKMLESYEMTYSELAQNSDQLSKAQLQMIQQGEITDWMYESRSLCEKIYATTKSGDKLGYSYMYDYVPVLRDQLQKGGIRLAALLNSIFS